MRTTKQLLTSLFFLLLFSCNDDFTASEKKDGLSSLPSISINTEDLSPIVSKEEYVNGTFEIASEVEEENLVTNIEIRGRGNSTWAFPKKPYQLKFSDKEKVLGIPKDKKWILLANYSDKTMLRNELAFELSRFSNLDWTPESRFVELSINNEYLGVYQITQKVEASSNRVEIGDDGYLLEVDQISRLDPDDVHFQTSNYLFNIKEPELEFGEDKYILIQDHINLIENVLMGSNFTDPVEGYTKYIDVASFIDWYLINEITKNNDAIFFSSVFLNYVPGGKLKMGPIWDYDISLGNIDYNGNETTDGFWVKDATWFSRLFEDSEFVSKVKSRFDHYYSNRDVFQANISSNAIYLNKAQQRNFTKWPILGEYVWPNYVYYPTYDEEVIYLNDWLAERLEWLKIAINELD
ncbi:CotH kinase family protein [Cyclobacterium amurskyense]|uniref:CotH protein n=1 Tax=Cyclobacterium amurskyense TaxID=320787 RepID=A0A0H4PFI3_9BACT|nr:CotH kinase family protein [Cyclobacterium amurskyense]AKP51835.1 CotH protein [Cyclobacterium amurskyense]|tara:strand:+ start:7860 stop:9083 length:1224 start_codon:yes stop_codon:yes gene_type:complete